MRTEIICGNCGREAKTLKETDTWKLHMVESRVCAVGWSVTTGKATVWLCAECEKTMFVESVYMGRPLIVTKAQKVAELRAQARMLNRGSP